MAKGKYEEWLEAEGLLKIEGWAKDGLTEEQIAGNMGIARSTLNEWKKKFPDISDTLKRAKEVVDRQVENALLKRALGYAYTEDKYISVGMRQEEYQEKLREHMEAYRISHPQAGEDELEAERRAFPQTKQILVERKKKEVAPDVAAQIFWLKNRKPEQWRDKQNLEVAGLEEEKTKLGDIMRQICGKGQ